jgi:hypothetical protein
MVSHKLANYLLSNVDGFDFEQLIQKLLALRYGDQFSSLGGIHDGGADGFFRSIREDRKRANSFIQISIQEDTKGKIRQTVNRLIEFGREVEGLTYWTNRKIIVDSLEDDLTEELDTFIRIRDFDQVVRLINYSPETEKIFKNHFQAQIFELTRNEPSQSTHKLDLVSDPSVYVFLQFERSERFSKGGMVAPIVDSLIYWALRNTNPDTPTLLSRIQLKNDISNLLPGAINVLMPNIDTRLSTLITKDGGGNQRVRHYRDSDSFCLPHSMRIELAEESAKEINLREEVRKSLTARAVAYGASIPEVVAETCERVLYRHFHEQGLVLAAFLDRRLEGITIFDQIVEEELRVTVATGTPLSEECYIAALKVLQVVLYTPSEIENEFLHRLSKTTLLLFTLKHSPKLIEYFNQMTGKFQLLVGADILIKALSEIFLPEEHKHVTNLLKVTKACGAKLVLTEPVANEVFTHLHATHLEFRNHYAPQEPYISPALASQSDRIMIRTYFYAKLLMKKVTGWKNFIEMFVEQDDLAYKTEKGQLKLQAFLYKTFDLEWLAQEELAKGIDLKRVDEISAELQIEGKKEILAKNDALMCLAVYSLRAKGHEKGIYDGFGFRTWWLTKETSLLKHTGMLVQENAGTPFIMCVFWSKDTTDSGGKAPHILKQRLQ